MAQNKFLIAGGIIEAEATLRNPGFRKLHPGYIKTSRWERHGKQSPAMIREVLVDHILRSVGKK